jgi:phosphatidylserine/phosphatidylglycerophosphate/cardiolipin synthase-like enzyme
MSVTSSPFWCPLFSDYITDNYVIMHNKFMVIDGRHTETGSFNYTAAAANNNAENVLVIWNTPELAAQYEREWQWLWDEATPLKKKY